jgi:hypothetical protein
MYVTYPLDQSQTHAASCKFQTCPVTLQLQVPPFWDEQSAQTPFWLPNPLAVLQALQSEIEAPVGRVMDRQLLQVVPTIKYPEGQEQVAVAGFQTCPFWQTHTPAYPRPLVLAAVEQSVQNPLGKTTKF